MPDPVRLIECCWRPLSWRRWCRWWGAGFGHAGAAGHDRRILGLAAGFYLGCWILKLRPHWPPALTDLDRLLSVVLPVAMATESLAVLPRVPCRPDCRAAAGHCRRHRRACCSTARST